jgi:hypothetical protein
VVATKVRLKTESTIQKIVRARRSMFQNNMIFQIASSKQGKQERLHSCGFQEHDTINYYVFAIESILH